MQQGCTTIGKKIQVFYTQFHALFAGNDGFVFRHSKKMVSGGYLLGTQVTCRFSAGHCCWHSFCCGTTF